MFRHFLWLLVLLPAWVAAQPWASRPLGELAIYPEQRVNARVEALDQARVAAEVGARIERVEVRVGDTVSTGDVLLRLDNTDYRIAADRASAQVDLLSARLALAEAQLEQARTLARQGFVSADGLRIRETELAVTRSELAAARQALDAARVALARAVVRAPFDGVVRERLASTGDYASPGAPLLVLASTRDTEIHALVPEAQVSGLIEGAAVEFRVGSVAYPVSVSRVLPLVESAGQTRRVIVAGPPELPPGRSGELRWRLATPHLPADYLVQREGQPGLWLERDGQPFFLALPEVATGRPIALDLPLDTRVIDEGRHALGLAPAPAQLPGTAAP